LVKALLTKSFVPIIACIGASQDGRLFNVNADTLAGSLAARLHAKRLVIAGTTPGVLGAKRKTVPHLDREAIDAVVSSGTATAGMDAKLRACRDAVQRGVREVVIVDGRGVKRLSAVVTGKAPKKGAWTRVTK
jgi:acetylglutamate kinase